MHQSFVYENDATHYEVSVMPIENSQSRYDGYILVSVSNFGECFVVKDLSKLAQKIKSESKICSIKDAVNIHNTIAYNLESDFMPIARITNEFGTWFIEYQKTT